MNQSVFTPGVPDMEARTIRISDFIKARSSEVTSLTSTLKNKLLTLNKIPFQLLPRHLRRRAMSHNKYRIPTRIRNRIREEDILLKTPSICRKHLRKSRLLLSSYARRSRRSRWLETHIWHAKRMKMREYFGYQVSAYCYDKSQRATYRYVKNDAALYDMSYYGVLEFAAATKKSILDFISPFCKTETLAWKELNKSKSIVSGVKAAHLPIYHTKNHEVLIQECECLWMPRVEGAEDKPERLWLIYHPSSKVYLEQIFMEKEETSVVNCRFFQDVLGIYHLMGPKSCAKVSRVLNQMGYGERETKDDYSQLLELFQSIHDPAVYPAGFVHYVSFNANVKTKLVAEPTNQRLVNASGLYQEQPMNILNDLMLEVEAFKNRKPVHKSYLDIWETSETPVDDVYGERFKTIVRGRFTHRKPKKRELEKLKLKAIKDKKDKAKAKAQAAKATPGEENGASMTKKSETTMDIEPTKEPTKDDAEKLIVEETPKVPEVQTNTMEEEKTTEQNPAEEKLPPKTTQIKKFDAIIIQDAGDNGGFGTGLKIITSPGNGFLFWRYAILSGCKALGMREYHQALNEARQPIFPNDLQNSICHEGYAQQKTQADLQDYFKKPAAKRLNYIRANSPYAFGPNWSLLPKPMVRVFVRAELGCVPQDWSAIFIPSSDDLRTFENQRGPDTLVEEPINNTKAFENPLKTVKPEEYLAALQKTICSRETIGYTTTGYHSYRFGFGCGKGFISQIYLDKLQKYEPSSSKPLLDEFDRTISYISVYKALFRNPSSRFYHLCRLYVLEDDCI